VVYTYKIIFSRKLISRWRQTDFHPTVLSSV